MQYNSCSGNKTNNIITIHQNTGIGNTKSSMHENQNRKQIPTEKESNSIVDMDILHFIF